MTSGGATDRLLIIDEAVFDASQTVEDFDLLWPEPAARFLEVNGQRESIIRIRSGEVQRWRLGHSGDQNDILLNLGGHAPHAITDVGIALATVESADRLLLAPGQRADLLIQAGEPGTYQPRSLPNDQGLPSPAGPLAWLEVAGAPRTMALPAALPAPPYPPITDDELTGSRTLVISAILPEHEAAGHWQEFAFLVDSRTFDPNRVDQTITLGAVEA